MSYDIRFGVKVEGMDYIAVIDRPEYDSPTYNLRDMFVACMDWDYEQGKWYELIEVYPKILHGMTELLSNPSKYKQYEPKNGWGTIDSAKRCLNSIISRVDEIQSGETWNTIPLEHLWIRW